MTEATESPRFALVGPVENGADRFLILDLHSPHADVPVMGEPVALIEDAGVYASLIVDVLNAHTDEYAARLDAVLASQPFRIDAGEWTPGWFGEYPDKIR